MKTKAFTGTWDVGVCCRAALARQWGGCGALLGEAWLLTVKESSLTRDGEQGEPVHTGGRGNLRPICRHCIDATMHCATVSLGKTGPGRALPTHSDLQFPTPGTLSF